MSIAEKLTTIAENEQKVYDAGKKSQYDEFWDKYQENGTKTSYMNCFSGGGWTDETFKPKYKIVPEGVHGARNMFYIFGVSKAEPLDYRTVAHMIDLSQVTQAMYTFYSARINHIEVDLSNCTTLQYAFSCEWNTSKRTHITLKVSEKCTNFANCFAYNSELTNLFFMEGSVIGANLSLSTCNLLVYDSIMSVINALKDYSGTSTTRTLTLHANAKAKLSDSDIAIATQKGWTIA